MAGSKVDLKVVMLGSAEVGKTCLVQRYLYGRFREQSATVGAAFGAKRITVHNTPITLGIWDTAGSERFEAMSRIYYKGARAAVVCFDMTSAATFRKVRFWIDELQANEPTCSPFVCATKLDLVRDGERARDVSAQEVRQLAQELGLDQARVFETSAKTGDGIQELFDAVAMLYDPAHPPVPPPGLVDPSKPAASASGQDGRSKPPCCGK